jgi:hypothetical protein
MRPLRFLPRHSKDHRQLHHVDSNRHLLHPSPEWGSFNNYVDPILPMFDPLPPLSGQLWTFYRFTNYFYLPFVHMTKYGLSTDHLPTSSCPHSYWMTSVLRVKTLFFMLQYSCTIVHCVVFSF